MMVGVFNNLNSIPLYLSTEIASIFVGELFPCLGQNYVCIVKPFAQYCTE